METNSRPLVFLKAAYRDYKTLPEQIQDRFGFALWLAQNGDKSPNAKPLVGFKGAGVLEVVEDFRGETYRAVYTVRFENAVYVLHAFQKKSKRGIATPKQHLDLIESRLIEAEALYDSWQTKHNS